MGSRVQSDPFWHVGRRHDSTRRHPERGVHRTGLLPLELRARFEVTPIPGTYRILLGLHARAVTNAFGSTALSAPLSIESRRSNPFRLDLP